MLEINNNYDFIVLSPHSDDAALSCGGFIYEKTSSGSSVLIATVFAGIPQKPYPAIAEEFHNKWGLEENPIETRREEDKKGIGVLGAEVAHLEYLDCIYRRNEEGADLLKSHADLFNELEPSEENLIEEISLVLRSNFKGRLLVPIGMGSHRDHIITRLAAEKSGLEIFAYYEEYPYWARKDRDHFFREPAGLSQQRLLLDQESLKIKKQAINCYKHPIKSLFQADTIEESSLSFTEQVNEERFWGMKI